MMSIMMIVFFCVGMCGFDLMMIMVVMMGVIMMMCVVIYVVICVVSWLIIYYWDIVVGMWMNYVFGFGSLIVWR